MHCTFELDVALAFYQTYNQTALLSCYIYYMYLNICTMLQMGKTAYNIAIFTLSFSPSNSNCVKSASTSEASSDDEHCISSSSSSLLD